MINGVAFYMSGRYLTLIFYQTNIKLKDFNMINDININCYANYNSIKQLLCDELFLNELSLENIIWGIGQVSYTENNLISVEIIATSLKT